MSLSLRILSLNCNGLGDEQKRKDVFDYLNRMNYDIYCLQETHFLGKEKTVKTECDGTWFFDSLTNISGGVAILFRKADAVTVVEEKTVDKGRCLMIEFFTGEKRCLLCCIYGYNEDKPLEEFFKQVEKEVDEFCCENVILCGDFNVVLNPELDYKDHSKSKTNSEARKALLKLMENQKLVDIFRKMNPGVPAFTYQRANHPSSARLDFFLISENLQSNFLPGIYCIDSGITKSGVVDHSIITLSFIKIGEGLWEFDNSLLLDNEFVESIKNWVPSSQLVDVSIGIYYQEYFERFLQEIKLECISYSANKNHSKTLHEQRRGVEEGELRSILRGIIPCIKLENDFIYEQSAVLKKTKEYYEERYCYEYNSAKNLEKYFSFLNEKKLSDKDKHSLDGYITWTDAKETLDRMKSNDSPGSDGFTLEFFKVFWEKLGHFVVKSINYAYDHVTLSKTPRYGIITCVPKENKPKHLLENWRPISQLNTVYKIASGSIAYRIQQQLEKIINPDQTGIIHGSKEVENIRLVYDVMQYTEEENIPGLLLFVDFEEAFDFVSWSFIEKSLESFNFDESIRKWIDIFQTGIKAAVNQGGNVSETFDLHRGCREGDPLSPYLIMICAEILAIKIRESNDINGINFLGREEKILTFTGDTLILMMDGSRESLESSLGILEKFAKMSGIHVNLDEAKGIWLGSSECCDFVLEPPNEALKLGEKTFKLHGIKFDTANLQNVCNMNIRLQLKNIREISRHWKHKKSIPEDLLKVLETDILPSCLQIFSTLPNPSDLLLDELERKLLYFAKGSTASRELLMTDCGGMKEIMMSMKLAWMKDLLQRFDLDKRKMVLCGRKYIQDKSEEITNMFWKDVLKAWLYFSKKSSEQKTHPASMEPLFFNQNILIENETIFYERWFKKKVVFVNDVLKENNSIMTLNEFKTKYNVEVTSPIYNKMRAAIEKWVKKENAKKVKMSQKKYIKSLLEAILNLAVQCNPSLQMHFTTDLFN